MSEAVLTLPKRRPESRAGMPVAHKALQASAGLWFLVAAAGQWAFVYYILGFFGGPTVRGDFEAWDRNTLLFDGYVSGDLVGNLLFAAHVLLAASITAGGTLQLVPQIRTRALWFHRWNGRLYIGTAFVISLAGLYLTWVRASNPTLNGSLAISANAVLIMVCATLAWRRARSGDLGAHRRWALRTFLVVSGVWFLRVGFMAWILIKRGAFGGAGDFDGPFEKVWVWGSFLLPLAVLELYLGAQKRAGAAGKFAMAAGLFVLTAVMGVGIAAAYLMLWRPLL